MFFRGIIDGYYDPLAIYSGVLPIRVFGLKVGGSFSWRLVLRAGVHCLFNLAAPLAV